MPPISEAGTSTAGRHQPAVIGLASVSTTRSRKTISMAAHNAQRLTIQFSE